MSGLVAEAESTHEIITITKHGRAVAALISADDLESLHETLYWLAKPDIADAIWWPGLRLPFSSTDVGVPWRRPS